MTFAKIFYWDTFLVISFAQPDSVHIPHQHVASIYRPIETEYQVFLSANIECNQFGVLFYPKKNCEKEKKHLQKCNAIMPKM